MALQTGDGGDIRSSRAAQLRVLHISAEALAIVLKLANRCVKCTLHVSNALAYIFAS
jgi:hypothetical protein